MIFDEEKEPTLGEQIDMLIFSGNTEIDKWLALRRLLVSRIPGATIDSVSTLPLSQVIDLILPLAGVLKNAVAKYQIDLSKINPKGSA